MNIEETLAKYTEKHNKYEEAYHAYMMLQAEMQSVLYDNEEPFELTYLNGEPTGIKIETPYDVAAIITGCVIAIGGAEWFRADGYWLSCYDTKKGDHEMFVRLIRNRDHVHLIHKAY